MANGAVENSMKFVYFHYARRWHGFQFLFSFSFRAKLVDGRPTNNKTEKQFEENLKVVFLLRDAIQRH